MQLQRQLAMELVCFTVVVVVTTTSGGESPGGVGVPEQSFQKTVEPFLRQYCSECHGGDDPEAGVALDGSWDVGGVRKHHETWERVLEMLEEREMPPKFVQQPTDDQRAAVLDWLEETLGEADAALHPGRVTLRRLNRAQYGNTIRDLLGVEFDATEEFPADDVGYGFDNIGDVLSLPPLLMEKYMAAAEEIADRAIVVDRADDFPESHRRIIFVQPGKREGDASSSEEATPRIIRRLAARAFRRPATAAEVERALAGLAAIAREEGESGEAGIRLALEAILCSPHFLFMVERDPADGEDPRLLNEYELATRISYFLWSSMPDDELFEYAGRGMLRANQKAQARRMLKNDKSQALVDQFAQQWFQLRNLEMVTPDKKQFGTFDDELRRDMATETLTFFAAVLREDRPLLDLIDGDFTFLNGRLARHYGIPGVEGDAFRRVSLEGTPRGGVLTQASVLTVTSNPTRTSPVKRGKWIMENILGTPPPDPPADVPMLDEQTVLTGSLRQRMEQHRKNPQCTVCHQTMDPLGFAMENFDAVGRWRTKDGEYEIDASGVLPDGKSFNGPAELREILLAIGREDFARCVTEKMLTYALGRGVERSDAQYVDEITQALSEGEYKLSSLILAIIRSDPFQKRSGKRS